MSKYIKLEDAIEQAKSGTNNYYICKAIESLPTIEVSEDCISRKDTLKALNDMAVNIGNPKMLVREDAMCVIDSQSSVVPSCQKNRQVGEWKWKSQDICDNCGYEVPHLKRTVGDTVLMDSKDWSYCPNCGAKMKG